MSEAFQLTTNVLLQRIAEHKVKEEDLLEKESQSLPAHAPLMYVGRPETGPGISEFRPGTANIRIAPEFIRSAKQQKEDFGKLDGEDIRFFDEKKEMYTGDRADENREDVEHVNKI